MAASSIDPLRFWVPGVPVSQPRPRVRTLPIGPACGVCGRRSTIAQTYSVGRKSPVAAWRTRVLSAAVSAIQARTPALPARGLWDKEEALQVKLDFILPRPRAHLNVKGEIKPRRREAQHLIRPDLDNLAKAVLDEMTGKVFERDEQVVCLRITKSYESAPGQAGVHVMARPFRVPIFSDHPIFAT